MLDFVLFSCLIASFYRILGPFFRFHVHFIQQVLNKLSYSFIKSWTTELKWSLPLIITFFISLIDEVLEENYCSFAFVVFT